MKKFIAVAILAVGSLAVMLVPEARAQVRRGGLYIIGSVDTPVQLNGPLVTTDTRQSGTIALTSASPSTATVTVRSGSRCGCWPNGTTATIAAAGCAASVSSTTLTLTGPNTVTTTMAYFCF